MLDLKNPINLSMLVTAGAFAISIGILYIIKPTWLQKLNLQGKPEISSQLLVSYSLTFALMCGVLTMLFFATKDTSIPSISHKPPITSTPSSEMINAYSSR